MKEEVDVLGMELWICVKEVLLKIDYEDVLY